MSDENDIQLNEEIIREENDPAVLAKQKQGQTIISGR